MGPRQRLFSIVDAAAVGQGRGGGISIILHFCTRVFLYILGNQRIDRPLALILTSPELRVTLP